MKYSVVYLIASVITQRTNPAGQNRVLSAAHGAPIVEVLNQYLGGTN